MRLIISKTTWISVSLDLLTRSSRSHTSSMIAFAALADILFSIRIATASWYYSPMVPFDQVDRWVQSPLTALKNVFHTCFFVIISTCQAWDLIHLSISIWNQSISVFIEYSQRELAHLIMFDLYRSKMSQRALNTSYASIEFTTVVIDCHFCSNIVLVNNAMEKLLLSLFAQ